MFYKRDVLFVRMCYNTDTKTRKFQMEGVKTIAMKIHIGKTAVRSLLACLALSVALWARAETDSDCWNFDTAYVPASPVVRTVALSDYLDSFAFFMRTIVLSVDFDSRGSGLVMVWR